MQQGHLGRDTLVRVQSGQTLEEVNLELVEAGSVLVHGDASESGEGGLEVRQLEGVRPVAFVGRAEGLEDLENLIDLTVAHEQRPLLSHLSKDAASRPEVNAEGVVLLAEQDLGAAVPESNHLVSVRFDGKPERSRKSEVGQLNGLSVVANQQVLRLQVSVENAV